MDDVLPGQRVDYKQAKQHNTLEIPPDLTAPSRDGSLAVPDVSPAGTATYSEYSNEQQAPRTGAVASAVLPEQEKIKFKRNEDRHWLVIQGEPDQVWPRVREFWLENGFLLRVDNPAIGIMETGWAENRADIPQGPIRKVLGKVLGGLYAAGTRDKFRVRLERGAQPGTTELFLTHQGMEEVIDESNPSPEGSVWKRRPRDHELEIEMLKRLMVFIGVQEKRAERMLAQNQNQEVEKPQARIVRTQEGDVSLVLQEGFSQAWRSTGLALDRVGFNVQDRDRAKRIYYVRYTDPERQGDDGGWLSKLAFWSDDDDQPSNDRFQVQLQPDGEVTRILVRGEDGSPDTTGTGERILRLLHEQLR